MHKPILILLVLACSVIAQGQADLAKRGLESQLSTLRSASKEPQDPGPSAALQRAVKDFLNSPEVETKAYKSGAFDTKVTSLKTQADETASALGREGPLVKAINGLYQENVKFRQTPEAASSPGPTPIPTTTRSPVASPTDESQPDEGLVASLSPYVLPVLQGLMILSALALLVYLVLAVRGIRRASERYFGGVLPQTFSAVKKGNEDLARAVEASTALNKDTNQRLDEVHREMRLMSRMFQQSALANNRTSPPEVSYVESAREDDFPSFPVSSEELLRRMERKSTVVKRDFQNDMLIADPEGKGELIILRDPALRDEQQPLLIVPSVTQLQMRQEYHNFYEKYFDCTNPESGSIWIIDPAVVEKVPGGWQLREKGRLEVR